MVRRFLGGPNTSSQAYVSQEAAAAALFSACKIEDTLKKSRDILCAAHNLKVPRQDHLSPDDPVCTYPPSKSLLFPLCSIVHFCLRTHLLVHYFALLTPLQYFEATSRTIIGLERLMLEAAGFDFRSRHPQSLLIKVLKHFGHTKESTVPKLAFKISIDLYRTFAPLKQSTAALAFACMELAERIDGSHDGSKASSVEREYRKWSIDRAMVMGTYSSPPSYTSTRLRSARKRISCHLAPASKHCLKQTGGNEHAPSTYTQCSDLISSCISLCP